MTGSADFSGTRTYVYDDAGNLTSKTTSGDYGAKSESYVYDGFGKLIKYVVNGEEKASYKYNGNGQRVEKTVNGAKTKYYWDGANIKNEGTASAVNATNYFGANGVFARKSGSVTNTLYKNGHGDTVLLTSGNTVVRDYDYDAYGKERGISPADENPFRYSGEYFDSETGFIYLRARYYSPSIGRFISEDTHWNVANCIYGDEESKNDALIIPKNESIMQSKQLYNYAINNPIKYIDSNGEVAIITCVIIGAIVGAVVGATAGAVISYKKYEEVRWQYVAIGAAVGATIGAAAGATIQAIGLTATGTIGTGLYETLEQGVNFTNTTLKRMTDPNRFVPVQTLINTIKYGTMSADPQGTSAIMYTTEMVKNGKTYTLEVLYDEASNTILHFLYK